MDLPLWIRAINEIADALESLHERPPVPLWLRYPRSPLELARWKKSEAAHREALNEVVRQWLATGNPPAGLSGPDAYWLVLRLLCAHSWLDVASCGEQVDMTGTPASVLQILLVDAWAECFFPFEAQMVANRISDYEAAMKEACQDNEETRGAYPVRLPPPESSSPGGVGMAE